MPGRRCAFTAYRPRFKQPTGRLFFLYTVQPIFVAIDCIAAQREVCSCSLVSTRRTARSRTSGEYPGRLFIVEVYMFKVVLFLGLFVAASMMKMLSTIPVCFGIR